MGANNLRYENNEPFSFFYYLIRLYMISCLLYVKWQKGPDGRLRRRRRLQIWIALWLESFYDPVGQLLMKKNIEMLNLVWTVAS